MKNTQEKTRIAKVIVPSYLSETPVGRHILSLSSSRSQDPSLPLFASVCSTSVKSLVPVESVSRPVTSSTGTLNTTSTPSISRKPGSSSTQKQYALPTYWNSKDRSQFIDLSHANLRASYQGTGKTDQDAASVRANHSIPPQCGIFYFEATVISKGREGYIAIGFSGANVALSRLPGWEDLSWGYHGDDGHSFCCSGTGKLYGPVFTTGDVIGCCINFLNMTASYTKNGIMLGVAFKDFLAGKRNASQVKLFPSIGLRTPGEVVEANFGQSPFKFDIDQYCADERMRLKHCIHASPSLYWIDDPSSSQKSRAVIQHNISSLEQKLVNEIILSHLIYHGYAETAKAFFSSAMAGYSFGRDGQSLLENGSQVSFDSLVGAETLSIRQQLQNDILFGRAKKARNDMNRLFPDLFSKRWDIQFQLKCLEFVDMISWVSVHLTTSGSHDSHMVDAFHHQTHDVAMDGMNIDEQADRYDLSDVIEFGQQLQREYAQHEDPRIQPALKELFSLICYQDPWKSPSAYFLSSHSRQAVATCVNSAILEDSFSKDSSPPKPILDQLYKQLSATISTLISEDVGTASYVDPESDILS